MKAKKGVMMITMGIIILGIIGGFVIFILLKMPSEDSWIKDDRGVWIKHGYPISKPTSVVIQEKAIRSALELYERKKEEGMNFSSQCLGDIGNYVVDLIKVC